MEMPEDAPSFGISMTTGGAGMMVCILKQQPQLQLVCCYSAPHRHYAGVCKIPFHDDVSYLNDFMLQIIFSASQMLQSKLFLKICSFISVDKCMCSTHEVLLRHLKYEYH
jgi:hypothetical protein